MLALEAQVGTTLADGGERAAPLPLLTLSKNKLQRPDFERVALAFETGVSPWKSVLPKHPGLKSETWATRSIIVRFSPLSSRPGAAQWL
jgi:hypothetical protein